MLSSAGGDSVQLIAYLGSTTCSSSRSTFLGKISSPQTGVDSVCNTVSSTTHDWTITPISWQLQIVSPATPGGSNTLYIAVGVGVLALVAAGVGFYFYRKRMAQQGSANATVVVVQNVSAQRKKKVVPKKKTGKKKRAEAEDMV